MAKVEINVPDLKKKTTHKTKASKKEVHQITSAKVKKPSIGKEFAASFINEDVDNVKRYVLFDVIIPTIKDTILDMISMAFYSDTYSSRGRRRGGGYYSHNERTNYNSYYRGDRDRDRDDRRQSTRRRRSSDIPEVIVDTHDDVRDVVAEMKELIDEYGACSVADLNDMVNLSDLTEHTDEKWGWESLPEHVRSRKVREGYLIELPRPKPID